MIGPNSEQLGVVNINRALELADEYGLDLIEVAPTAAPPVCRIIDFSKYKYDQQKKERKVKKHPRPWFAHLSRIGKISLIETITPEMTTRRTRPKEH